MKKLIAFLTALITLCGVSCSGKNTDSSSRIINGEQVQIVDNSRIYKKTELPFPDELQGISNIFYNEKSGNIHIFGTDSEGNEKVCITDSDFSMYSYADLKLKIDHYKDENIAFAVSENNIFAVISTAEQEEENEELSYTYGLKIYDNSGNMLSVSDFAVDDSLLSDCLYKGIRSLNYAGENRLILGIDSTFLLVDTEGNVIETLTAETAYDYTESVNGYIRHYVENNGYYGITADKTTEKLIDFTDSGLSGISAISPIANGDFVCFMDRKLYRLSERDMEEYGEMQEITLAAAGFIDEIQPMIADFNAESNLYQIKLKNYSDSYEYSIEGLENAVNDLEIDIISGNIPDMVYLDTNEIEKLSSKGAFADLYELMDSDSKYSRDAFLPNYLEATETDGHIYSIAPTFTIKSIAAKSRHTDIQNWTFDEFRDVYNSKSADMTLFESANNRNAVFGFLSDDCNDFVDYGTHTCYFNSQDFIDILEFSADFPSVEEYSWETTSCHNDSALISTLFIESFRDINVEKQSIFGDDITFVGFPSESGNGSVITLSNQFAIMEDSPVKDGAWSFIRTFFSDDRYYGNISGIPVTEKGFEIAMEEALEPPYYIDGESNNKIPMKETGYNFTNGSETEITPMSEAEQAKYEAFVRSITKAVSGHYDDKINGIVSEEVSRYFAGACSAEECAEMIQNRVSIMLIEQS